MRIESASVRRRSGARDGQALIELACGMFALVLVLSLLCLFVKYVVKSLQMENHIRSDVAVFAAKVEVDRFAAEKVLGIDALQIKEPHGTTDRTIP